MPRVRGLVAAPLLVFAGLTLLVIARPGFTPDEEITAVVTRGIASSGLPLLPSGVLYPRGVPQLYAAWLVSAVVGHTMWAWRGVSLLAGLAGVFAAWRVGLRFGGVWPALVTALLVATLPPYVAAGAFARPYAALMAVALVILTRDDWGTSFPWIWTGLIALAALLHPLGLSLAVLPVLMAALRSDAELGPAARATARGLAAGGLATGLVHGAHWWSLRIAQIASTRDTALYAIPRAAPTGPAITDLASAGAWAVAGAVVLIAAGLLARRAPHFVALIAASAVCAVANRLGFLVLIGFVAALMEPRDLRRIATIVVTMFGVGAGFWTVHTAFASHAAYTVDFARSLAGAAAGYPLGQVRVALMAFPVLTVLAAFGVGRALREPDGGTSALVRALALLSIAILVLFTVAGLPVNERYLLLPWVLLTLVAAFGAAELSKIVQSSVPARRHAIGVLVVSAATCVTVWAGHVPFVRDRDMIAAGSAVERALAPPTGPSWSPDVVASVIEPTDTLVCTEELACAYLLGRVDFLFALPPADVAHYVVNRGGEAVGFYAGAPVVSTASDLQRVVDERAATGCVAIVALRSGKVGFDEYLAVVDGLRERLDVSDALAAEDVHVSRVCPVTLNAGLTSWRMP